MLTGEIINNAKQFLGRLVDCFYGNNLNFFQSITTVNSCSDVTRRCSRPLTHELVCLLS